MKILNPTLEKVPKRSILFLISFLAGAAVMVVEMAGGRLLSTWFGNSLFTWTGLIGIVLVSMSAGSYLGGYTADRCPHAKPLGHILLVSGLWSAFIPLLQKAIDTYFASSHVVWGPLLASSVLFAIPALLLGMVSPLVTRLNSLWSEDHKIGNAIGSIGMLATLGSVIGTFLTGLVLIPNIRIDFIYYMTGLVLAVLSLFSYNTDLAHFAPKVSKMSKGGVAGILAVLLVFLGLLPFYWQPTQEPYVVFEKNTFYHRIRVHAYPLPNGDTLSKLSLDTTFEGGRYKYSKEMPSEYQRYWELIKYFKKGEGAVKQAAFLGGGAFLMPLVLLEEMKDARADVVEIDPAVVDVGRRYFEAGSNERMNIVVDDARRFLYQRQHVKDKDKKYDFIFGDTYNGIRYIPAHFVTKEFFTLVKNNLNSNGVFMMNIISSVVGKDSQLFQSIMTTLNTVFPYTHVFAVSKDQLSDIQNIILVATETPVKLSLGDFQEAFSKREISYGVMEYLSAYVSPENYNLSKGQMFTDLFNPVEFIVAKGLLRDNK